MNKGRRKAIELISLQAEELKGQIECLRDEEQDYFDNMPESLQSSQKGEDCEMHISFMDVAIDSLDEVITNLNDCI
jgi:hypothetical protein